MSLHSLFVLQSPLRAGAIAPQAATAVVHKEISKLYMKYAHQSEKKNIKLLPKVPKTPQCQTNVF